MQCPICSTRSLKPIKLHSRLPARECMNCHGVLIDLLSYRAWAKSDNQDKTNKIPKLVEVKDHSKAIVCPKCSKIMLKFRISGEVENKIDLCGYCDEAWLDDGEWQLLGYLGIQNKLNAIFTEPWQRDIRDENERTAHEKRFSDMLGAEQYNKPVETKKWVESHKNKDDLIRYTLKKN